MRDAQTLQAQIALAVDQPQSGKRSLVLLEDVEIRQDFSVCRRGQAPPFFLIEIDHEMGPMDVGREFLQRGNLRFTGRFAKDNQVGRPRFDMKSLRERRLIAPHAEGQNKIGLVGPGDFKLDDGPRR